MSRSSQEYLSDGNYWSRARGGSDVCGRGGGRVSLLGAESEPQPVPKTETDPIKRRMAAMILLQSVKDLLSSDPPIARAARQWFRAETDHPLGLQGLCESMGLDVDSVREQALDPEQTERIAEALSQRLQEAA